MRDDDRKHAGLSRAEFWHYYQRYPYLLAKGALWLSVVLAFYWMTRNVQSVLFPVMFSLLLAYLLDPAVDWFEEKVKRVAWLQPHARTAAISVFMSVIVLAFVGFILVLYPALAQQVTAVVRRTPELVNVVQDRLLPWVEQTTGYEVPATVSEALTQYGGTIREQIPAVMKRLSAMTAEILTQTGAVVVSILNLVMIPIFSFYFLRDFDLYKERLREFVPVNRRDFYMSRIAMMDEVVGAWFRGQVTVAVILAVLYAVGLSIVFGVAGVGAGSGFAIGVLSGLLNIVPYFGFLIGFVLSVLMVVLDWGGVGPLIGVGVVFAVVQGLEGWVITPKIVGDKVGLSPVAVIIVLLLGGEIFGLLGVLLALPVAGMVRVLMPDFIEYYKRTPFYSGNYEVEVARAEAAGRASGSVASGLAEQTDGTVEESEPVEDLAPQVEPGARRRPVTAEHASVGDRPQNTAVALDVGTDGDAGETDEPEAQEEVEEEAPEARPTPPSTPAED